MKLFDYNSNLEAASLMLESGIKNAVTPVEEQEVYLNAYNIISDFIDELAGSPLSLGQRISTLYNIVNSKVTQKILSYISRNRRSATFKNISSNNFYSDVFSKMLDAYTICERDSECIDKLLDVMHHNVYLYDLNNVEFLLEYPEILKKIYNNDLENALKDICSILGSDTLPDVELSSDLAKLLTYLSAALELPDVYVYSKKLNLDLSIIKKDYFVASGIIKDLEYMQYKNPDIKYYKALIKQKSSETLRYKFH